MKFTITACFECWSMHETEEVYEACNYEERCIKADMVSGIVAGRQRYAVVASYEFSNEDQAIEFFHELRPLEMSKSKSEEEKARQTHASLYADEELIDSFGDISPFVRLVGTGWTSVEILTVA